MCLSNIWMRGEKGWMLLPPFLEICVHIPDCNLYLQICKLAVAIHRGWGEYKYLKYWSNAINRTAFQFVKLNMSTFMEVEGEDSLMCLYMMSLIPQGQNKTYMLQCDTIWQQIIFSVADHDMTACPHHGVHLEMQPCKTPETVVTDFNHQFY